MASLNPYLLRRKKSITYSVVPADDGWNIEVSFPLRVPASDKAAVLEWIRQYRHQVKAAHPLWSTTFHPFSDRYLLEIRRANNDKELIAIGEQLRSVCGEIMEYAR